MAHRVDLAAKAISSSHCAKLGVDACSSVAASYGWGGERLQKLHKCRDELGLRKVTLKSVAETRWVSYAAVIDRVFYLLPAILLATVAALNIEPSGSF
jgi:hypothetical protein